MSKKKTQTIEKRLEKAYEHMLERVRQDIDQIKDLGKPLIKEAIKQAKQTAVDVEEVSIKEAENIAYWLGRDLEDFSQFINDAGEFIKDRLVFDISFVEERLWSLFKVVADKTRLDMTRFNYRLKMGPEYRSGELTGVGSLQCDNCAQEVHFHKISHIPPCPKCHGKVFSRLIKK